MPQNIYLDYSATTPIDPRVVEKMLPYFTEDFGNTSSAHRAGRSAEDAVEAAREVIAGIFNCELSEIIFTSGGSESDNLAIRGAGWAARAEGRGNHLITTPVEHSAVSRTIDQMANLMGFEKTILPVDRVGQVDPEDLVEHIRDTTTVASVIYANNEVGTIAPLRQLAEQAHTHDVLLHTDAVQATGQLSLDVHSLGVDLMSISAHKFYGPKGVGALYCRQGIDLESNQTGGTHESGRRAGTLNTAGIVGMAEALRLAYEERDQHLTHYRALTGQLTDGIQSRISGAHLTGDPVNRLPSHTSFVFEGVESTMLLMHLDMKGIAASSASACKTGNPEPSSVLMAMGYPPELAAGSLRLTVGRATTETDIAYALDILEKTIEKLRKLKREKL
ncbi:MAG: cysteine desulfurase family protein [Chloroflexota bacterium]